MPPIDKCRKAYGRAFGQSLIWLHASITNTGLVHIRDVKTGAWALYDIRFSRIRRVNHSGATP